jgi:hypothetical protein
LHNFWLYTGLIALALSLGVLPIVSGMWLWILIPLLLTGTALTFITGLQLVLLVIGIVALFGAAV